LTQWSRALGAALGLFLLTIVLSACGGTPVAQNWPGLTLADETIYVISGSPQRVYMLDATNGTQKGTFSPIAEPKGTVWWSPVTVGGGIAFVGFTESSTETGALYAFDPETGQELWNVAVDSLILPEPFYADGTVYVGASDGCVYAADVETKRLKPGWPPRNEKGEVACQTEDAIWATPLVSEGRVYVAAMDHHVYSLDAESGEVIWRSQVGGAMAAPPTLVLEDGILYVGAFDGKLYAIEAESGKPVEGFSFEASNWIWSKVLALGDQLYVTALDGKLYALDPSSGAEIWSYCSSSEESSGRCQGVVLRASPVESGGSIIIATEAGEVMAVADAVRQWEWPSGTPEAGILTTPVVSGDILYVVLMNGQVQALEAENGTQRWTFSPPVSD
jgi:outer membrane protein assembly factor BamB